MSTRAERIIDHAQNARAIIDGKSRWHNCQLEGGLTLSTQVAILDSRSIHEIKTALNDLIAEAHDRAAAEQSTDHFEQLDALFHQRIFAAARAPNRESCAVTSPPGPAAGVARCHPRRASP